MKLLGVLFLLLLPLSVEAGELCSEHYLGLITVSQHIFPKRKYNEEHWGPYWRCRFNQDWSGQVGWYPNSFNRDTFYGLVNYVPWRWRDLRFGGSVGAGTGYAEYRDGRPKGGLSPLVGGLAIWKLNEDFHAGLFINPAVVALIVEARWR
mgnify:CR=1 FL=1